MSNSVQLVVRLTEPNGVAVDVPIACSTGHTVSELKQQILVTFQALTHQKHTNSRIELSLYYDNASHHGTITMRQDLRGFELPTDSLRIFYYG